MAQLKSGSTVGGQTIASTAQTGSPTGYAQVGTYIFGYAGQSYTQNQVRNSGWSSPPAPGAWRMMGYHQQPYDPENPFYARNGLGVRIS